ncbi:hypothetical protein R0J87_20985, partial [Halomonas sp. SIMBA_159]
PVKRFSGSFEGLGHAVTGLTVARSGSYSGLFGQSSGAIRGVGLRGGSITGADFVGGLVGYNTGTLTGVYATATVSGASDVGGLAGSND